MIIINNWKIDVSRCTLTHQGTEEILRLGEFHFLLLEILISYPDTVLSREYLIAEVWKNRVVGSNSLPTAIHALRLALGDDSKQKEIIQTIPKKGYLLNSAFISYPDEATLALPSSNANEHETKETIAEPLEHSVNSVATGKTATSSHKKSSKPIPLKPNLVVLLVAMVVTLALVTLLRLPTDNNNTMLSHENTPENSQLKTITMPGITHINLHDLYESGTDSTDAATINKNWHPLAVQLENLLTENSSHMDVYSYLSMEKITFDLVITNHCRHTWQIIFIINNRKNDMEKINNLIYKHTERTLHEMPTCE